MSLLSRSKSRQALLLFLWLSMLFLVWQHYRGLNQIPTGPVDQDLALPTTQQASPSLTTREKDESLYPEPANPSRKTRQAQGPASFNEVDLLLSSIAKTSQYFLNDVLSGSAFSNMGQRLQVLGTWLQTQETLTPKLSPSKLESLQNNIERATLSLFPFIANPTQPRNAQPFTSLRQSYQKGSEGILLVASKHNLRYICHLIKNIRVVLNSTLPIQVAHAGDTMLSPSRRRFLTKLAPNITTMDVTKLLDDHTLELEKGGPAIRSFAALATPFEKVLLMGSLSVFLQPPERILQNHRAFKDTGALLFHHHLYGKGEFKESHDFWHKHLRNHEPSPALKSSRVYNEGYAEELDPGFVALDKSRLPTLMGLLHVCWQNTKRVRRDYSYALGDGDRDTWWLGFELSASPYAWNGGYGGTVGWLEAAHSSPRQTEANGGKRLRHERVCGNTNLHLDEAGRPLWFSGGLLKDRRREDGAFGVEMGYWMVDGVWQPKKGEDEEGSMDCMWGGEVRELGAVEKGVLERSVEEAREVDEKSRRFVGL
ncbi:MAG: hypothetical protein Q9202_002822 [Teloschistes flavicans]